jgi:hypothetical protein
MRARLILALAVIGAGGFSQEGWWMREPIRWIQTNLREADTALDPERLVNQLAELKANVLLFGMGGIVAHYPTDIPFHRRSPYLPAGGDTFGEVLRRAHAQRIRVVGRFDFSKAGKEVFDVHPEWFFRQANGEPVVYNGLYSTCINGGYYREHAMKILTEALDRYDVDGLFFNMFGNQSTDYSGRFVGHCHCDSCRKRFRARYQRDLPSRPNAAYEEFMFISSREVAAEIGKLIRSKRPNAGYFNYIQQYTDGIMSESNTAVRRPLPLWPYASSDNVNRARNSEPGKMPVNLCMSFIDFPWRFATVPQGEISLRLWQNVAHGGAAAFVVAGTMDQQDRQSIEAARPVFSWLAANEDYYHGQQSMARVLLLGRPPAGRGSRTEAYRGLFRLLSEEHVPFAVVDNLDWLGPRRREVDLVVASDWAPQELDGYIRDGGRALVVSSRPPGFPVGQFVRKWEGVQGYFRVRSPELFPSLRLTRLMMLNGDYAEYQPNEPSALTLIPPSMFGPPEKVHIDQVETDKPGLLIESRGKGRLAYLPWDAAVLYYLHSSQAHAGLLRDLIDNLLPRGRQLKTNAHPLVEITLMKQPSKNRTLVHLVNLSGHSQTAYFPPVPMSDISVSVEGEYRRARALRSGVTLATERDGRYSVFRLPRLGDYEAVVLE